MLCWKIFIPNTRNSWLSCHVIHFRTPSRLGISNLRFNIKHHQDTSSFLRLMLHIINNLYKIIKIRGRDIIDNGTIVRRGDIFALIKFQCLIPTCCLILFMLGKLGLRRYNMLLFPIIPSIIIIPRAPTRSGI